MSNDFNHGIVYSPSTIIAAKPLDVEDLVSLNISYVQVTWVDLTALVRYRVVPISYFKKMLSSSRPGIALAKAALGLVYLNLADGFRGVGEDIYALDMSTLRISPYKPGYASVMGWFQEKSPIRGADGQLTIEAAVCPRSLLRRVVAQARSETGVEFLCGFETEFILLKSTKKPTEGANYHHWSHSSGLLAGSVENTILQEIVDSLVKGGIEVTMFHAEAAPGQYEIVSGPLLPLESADAYMYTRETIVNVAAKHGMHATFAPRVFKDSTGTGAHVHVSVHSRDDIKIADQLSSAEALFVSGLLKRLPAIVGATLPTPASYKRVGDGSWSGGTYICWGTENREAPIRLANASSPLSRNFELRFLDGTCNPYVGLALILASGVLGIKNNESLTVKDCAGPKTAAEMTVQERVEHGIPGRLPLTWDAARDLFSSEPFVRELLGEELTTKFLSVHKKLKEMLEVDGDTEEDRLTRLVEFY